jgi:uncharacterized protein YjbJ (UPF0337 family)
MHDHLDELKATIKTLVGRLIGNGRLERGGRADLVLARARRKTKGVLRQVGGTLKVGLGQMTHYERLAAQGRPTGCMARLSSAASRQGAGIPLTGRPP